MLQKMIFPKLVTVLGATVVLTTTAAQATTLIDFEDQTTDDVQVLSTDYNSHGIRFVPQTGTTLFYERSGNQQSNPALPNGVTSPNPTEGFVSDTATPRATYDKEDPAFAGQLGNFFLRGNPSADPNPANQWPGNKALPFFSIEYLRAPTQLIGGQIWDIDGINGSEKWSVIARDSGGAQLAIATSLEYFVNNSTSLDAKPWMFSFDPTKLSGNVARIDFMFQGTKNAGIGVAFDNFQSGVVPEPATWAMLILGFGLVGATMRRRADVTRVAA